MRIGLDVDGVVIDFNQAMRDAIGSKTAPEPLSWDWAAQWNITDQQFRDAIRKAQMLSNTRPESYWLLSGYDTDALFDHEIYFITARPASVGHKVLQYAITEGLNVRGAAYSAHDKYAIARGMGLDCFLDDGPKYVQQFDGGSIPCWVRTWDLNKELAHPRRVGSVHEYVREAISYNG